ncbi:hypothetical protein PRZ48_004707 [Zasmidium cellare]|uniref:Uncharacterized protein n=1 Tax=Zasmidium cellare TaxID=395010 RepID=A0ABR0EQ99_ZASCE|nr:hypothetical protein PRZ48_004707 [Zasmidium cellare]
MALKKQYQDKQITRFGTASQISTARKHRDELLKLIASVKTGRDAAHFEEFVENLEWEAMRMLPYATARPEAAEQAQRDYDAAVAEWEGESDESSEDEPPPPKKKKISKRVVEDSEDEDDTSAKRALSKAAATKKTTTTTIKGKALAAPKKSALKEVTNTVKVPRGKKRSLDEDDDAAEKVAAPPKKAKMSEDRSKGRSEVKSEDTSEVRSEGE